jgi:hypothetical protein
VPRELVRKVRRDRYGDEILDDDDPADEHDPACVDGWLGGEFSPVPCPQCRPHLRRLGGRWVVDRNAFGRKR